LAALGIEKDRPAACLRRMLGKSILGLFARDSHPRLDRPVIDQCQKRLDLSRQPGASSARGKMELNFARSIFRQCPLEIAVKFLRKQMAGGCVFAFSMGLFVTSHGLDLLHYRAFCEAFLGFRGFFSRRE